MIKQNKAVELRLYPTKEQQVLLNKTFGCCRKVYNLALAEAIESYKQTGKFIAGIVEDTQMSDDLDGAFVAFGTWGNYFITDEDSFICL